MRATLPERSGRELSSISSEVMINGDGRNLRGDGCFEVYKASLHRKVLSGSVNSQKRISISRKGLDLTHNFRISIQHRRDESHVALENLLLYGAVSTCASYIKWYYEITPRFGSTRTTRLGFCHSVCIFDALCQSKSLLTNSNVYL